MRAARCLGIVLVAAVVAMGGAYAKKRRGKKVTTAAVASKQTVKEVNQLLGNYKWGIRVGKVLSLLSEEIRGEYRKRIEHQDSASY